MKKFHLIFCTLIVASLPFSGKTAAPRITCNLIAPTAQKMATRELSKKVRYPSLNKELYLQRTNYRLFLQKL